LKVEERIARLLGLDAPTRVESDVNAVVTQRPAELDDLLVALSVAAFVVAVLAAAGVIG